MDVDWDEQAGKNGQYLIVMSFSGTGLVQQLVSDRVTDDQGGFAVARVHR